MSSHAQHRLRDSPVAVPSSSTTEGLAPTVGNSSNCGWRIEPSHVCIGCILWLPAQEGESGSAIHCVKPGCRGEELEESRYNHPVLVLKIHQRKGSSVVGDLICDVASMTTFGKTKLEKYLSSRTRTRIFQSSLPISQNPRPLSSSHDAPRNASTSTNIPFLYLEPSPKSSKKEKKLRKQGYVRCDHIFSIPVAALRTYGFERKSKAHSFRIDEESYKEVMKKLSFSMKGIIFEDRDTLAETATARLAALARSPVVEQPVLQAAPVESTIAESTQTTRSNQRDQTVYSSTSNRLSYAEVLASRNGSLNRQAPAVAISSRTNTSTARVHRMGELLGYNSTASYQQPSTQYGTMRNSSTISTYPAPSHSSYAPSWSESQQRHALPRYATNIEPQPSADEPESGGWKSFLLSIGAVFGFAWFWWRYLS